MQPDHEAIARAYARLLAFLLEKKWGGSLYIDGGEYNRWEAGHVDGLLKMEPEGAGIRITVETGQKAEQVRALVEAKPQGRPS